MAFAHDPIWMSAHQNIVSSDSQFVAAFRVRISFPWTLMIVVGFFWTKHFQSMFQRSRFITAFIYRFVLGRGNQKTANCEHDHRGFSETVGQSQNWGNSSMGAPILWLPSKSTSVDFSNTLHAYPPPGDLWIPYRDSKKGTSVFQSQNTQATYSRCELPILSIEALLYGIQGLLATWSRKSLAHLILWRRSNYTYIIEPTLVTNQSMTGCLVWHMIHTLQRLPKFLR